MLRASVSLLGAWGCPGATLAGKGKCCQSVGARKRRLLRTETSSPEGRVLLPGAGVEGGSSDHSPEWN